MTEIRPQSGPQEQFLSSPADIAIYGGAAGGGKTYALLMEPLRHVGNGDFGAVYFRRTMPQITSEGGAWDKSYDLYGSAGATMIQSPNLQAQFPSGAKVSYSQLQYEDSVHNWQSSQIPLILMDELTQFTRRQFFYMLSRNRSTCGVSGYLRAATNPDPDSWVKEFISWWLDPETGYAIPERSGIIRWFARLDDEIVWAGSREELLSIDPRAKNPMSVTFIPSDVYDNKIMLGLDPSYISKLESLPRWERERLLGGNWNSRPSAGTIFSRSDFKVVDVTPRAEATVRYWDRAATEPSEASPDPDWTAGVSISRCADGLFYINDVDRFRARPLGVKVRIRAVASQDGRATDIGIEQDPGSAGVSEADDLVLSLAGYSVRAYRPTGSKVNRWKPLSAQAQAGNVLLARGPWNEAFISELCALTDSPGDYGHDDQADAAAGAFNALQSGPPSNPKVGAALAARRRPS